ncbi:nickel pincer cofactor biosynthesis protein LarC [Motilibacter aurantiacus]|uniref:nickel pincer cofactor biosynthesis protein LarC n=1 Tax=Motilibacter aurantiacus TaxID=2714955 RepID=UPI00140DC541|nr:nickel pincer cofactor biosynthesis protein LarC [Motilibacter aurantiacus]NHC46715.1 nickel pincer cofactor biosynthesis protein LarC [Motilibacter aurantiacus]
MSARAVGWVDASCGASGDMLLGALTDLGAVDVGDVAERLQLAVSVETEPVLRAGIGATAVRLRPAHEQPSRTWRDIRTLLETLPLPEAVGRRALSTFARLAAAEGAVHRVAPEDVHFHEVGAVDSLMDVVGACWGLAALRLDTLHCTPLALGAGTVRTAHGVLPVPGPAVVRVLADAAVPAHGGPVPVELCTPTGAALLAEHVDVWGPMPALVLDRVGTGAGSRSLPDRPNVLRVLVGAAAAAAADAASEREILMETNVDDLDPRLWPAVLRRLMDAGARDAWLTPILMKKGRPAHTLSVLAGAADAHALRELVFRETSALGVRERAVAKHALERSFRTVEVDGAVVRVKVGLLHGQVVNVQPEYEDVAAAGAALGRSEKSVLAAAIAAAEAAR